VDRARSADGRVRIHMCDIEPLDVAHEWAVANGVRATRSKRTPRDSRYRDQHIVTFARHPELLATGSPRSKHKHVPSSVLGDRAAWIPFLAGFFDGDGYVRKDNREIVFVSISALLIR